MPNYRREFRLELRDVQGDGLVVISYRPDPAFLMGHKLQLIILVNSSAHVHYFDKTTFGTEEPHMNVVAIEEKYSILAITFIKKFGRIKIRYYFVPLGFNGGTSKMLAFDGGNSGNWESRSFVLLMIL